MEMVLAVPLTHLFLATVIAYSLPNDVKECRMKWEGYETVGSKQVSSEGVTVTLQVGERKTRYEFKSSKVTVSERDILANGQAQNAVGHYDLDKAFGVRDPAQWRTATDVTLKNAKGQAVTMKLDRHEKEIAVEESSGDSAAVFGYLDQKFPQARIRWK